MTRPTIGLVISVGWGVRTFLQSEVLPTLARAARVVVLTDPSMVEDLRARWGDQVAVEALYPFAGPQHDASAYGHLQGRHELAFQQMSMTTTRRAKQQMHRPHHWRHRLSLAARRARARMSATPARVARLRQDAGRAFLDHNAEAAAHYEQLFRQHALSMVVTTVAYLPIETPPLLVARRMGLATGCWVNSWDNLSSKGPMPQAFDHYFTWSEQVTDELRRYYPESADRPCRATGVPHFDGYASPASHWCREVLCERLDLDPARPIVLYATCTPFLAPNEHLVVERLADAMSNGKIAGDPQLVVRLHPNDPGTRFEALEQRPGVHLQLARTSRDTTRSMQAFLPTDDENQLAINTIRHADTVINIASTITLEAAISDRPVINVAYDLGPEARHTRQIERYYRYSHYRTVLDHDAVDLARSPEALLDGVRQALADPTHRRAGRRALAHRWCGPSDSGAGERLGTALVAALTGVTAV